MKNTWIMLANETKAYIYSVNKDNIELIDTLKHADSRLQDHQMVSDRSGSYNTSAVGGTGHFQPETDQHTVEQQTFARQIGAHLAKANSMHNYHDLVICAEPHFYGMIKKELTSNVWNSVTHHILKDYIPLSENKIKDILKHLVSTRFEEAA
jgi:protein required for attachment to host cells